MIDANSPPNHAAELEPPVGPELLEASPAKDPTFPTTGRVVGIGASAGGHSEDLMRLEAIRAHAKPVLD